MCSGRTTDTQGILQAQEPWNRVTEAVFFQNGRIRHPHISRATSGITVESHDTGTYSGSSTRIRRPEYFQQKQQAHRPSFAGDRGGGRPVGKQGRLVQAVQQKAGTEMRESRRTVCKFDYEEAGDQLRASILDLPTAARTKWKQGERDAVAMYDVYLGQRLER